MTTIVSDGQEQKLKKLIKDAAELSEKYKRFLPANDDEFAGPAEIAEFSKGLLTGLVKAAQILGYSEVAQAAMHEGLGLHKSQPQQRQSDSFDKPFTIMGMFRDLRGR